MNDTVYKIVHLLMVVALAAFITCSDAPTVSESEEFTTAGGGNPGTTQMTAMMVVPVDGEADVPVNTDIFIQFSDTVEENTPLSNITTTSIAINGTLSGGPHAFSVLGTGTTRLQLTPTVPFTVGEHVTVQISNTISNPGSTNNLDTTYNLSFDIVP